MNGRHAGGGGVGTHPLPGDAVGAPLGPRRLALSSPCAPSAVRLASETPPLGVGAAPTAAFRRVIT
jgi:hypothetical protein